VHVEHESAELRSRLREDARNKIMQARKDGAKQGWAKAQNMLKGKDRRIDELSETIRQLRRGATPQDEGLAFEPVLVARLDAKFKEYGDDVKHRAKVETCFTA
jgi:hypothetical protein